MKQLSANYVAKFVTTTNIAFTTKSGTKMMVKAVSEGQVSGLEAGLYIYKVADLEKADMTKPFAIVIPS